MQYAVETISLTKVFPDWWGRDRVRAVDGLSLRINYNEVYGLLGPNGSGKTTTLKMLLGLLYPTKGKALLLGGDATDTKISARIGFLPEESYLYKYLTARETLDFYGRLFGLSSEVRRMRIEALLEMVGLKAAANRPVGTFSKGMARRIGLAQALINDPDLLILDEPTTGLDPIGTRQIKDLIIELAKRGKTILLSSHLLGDVEDVCDRIAILYGGKIQSEGKVKELLLQTNKTQILTDTLSPAALAKIKQIIEAESMDCEVSSPLDKLESFFIRIVAAAQAQGTATSGAVSKTGISDFLSAASVEEVQRARVIDKLVSASPVEEPVSTNPVEPQPADHAAEPIRKDVIASLAGSSSSSGTQPSADTQTKPVEPVSQHDGEIKRDILEQLLPGHKKIQKEQPEKEPDGRQENSTNE
jgi:ABC-2 type transport system ATP-binding protein